MWESPSDVKGQGTNDRDPFRAFWEFLFLGPLAREGVPNRWLWAGSLGLEGFGRLLGALTHAPLDCSMSIQSTAQS